MIPLSVPNICGNEWKYVKDCLDTEWVSSAGKYVDLFEKKISQYSGSKYAIACVNGTSALQVSLRLEYVSVSLVYFIIFNKRCIVRLKKVGCII